MTDGGCTDLKAEDIWSDDGRRLHGSESRLSKMLSRSKSRDSSQSRSKATKDEFVWQSVTRLDVYHLLIGSAISDSLVDGMIERFKMKIETEACSKHIHITGSFFAMFMNNFLACIKDEWKIENVDEYSIETRQVPQQDGSLDCGIFMMGYIYSIINNTPPFIYQDDCELLRAKIAIAFISEEAENLLEYAFTEEVDSKYTCLGCDEC
ncbi:uncharacterized protein A4U43_C07F26470 [Asparagus officinalis]|uniref:Ubiquitin-like protease family profile domain-containing protein n=1 Tax=Asparagus officinalis TaxID=4686 RepID=A0A5P1EF28_ASPOF|nr:uncharacterized protein A4U43_C07F26470 [Asparagus officinalis]